VRNPCEVSPTTTIPFLCAKEISGIPLCGFSSYAEHPRSDDNEFRERMTTMRKN